MLKNTIKTIIISTTLMLSGLWADGVKTVEDIGKQAFAILKNLDNEDLQSFKAKLASKEETLAFLREQIKDKEKQQRQEQHLNERMEKMLQSTFNELKTSHSENIQWDNITFKGFVFENDDGGDEIDKTKDNEGELYFSSGVNNFSVEVHFFLLQETYHILLISSLSTVDGEVMQQQLNKAQ